MLAVITILVVMVIVYMLTKPSEKKDVKQDNEKKDKKENFSNMSPNTLNIPPTLKPDAPVTTAAATPEPSNEPGTLQGAPYQQIAKNSPLPYQDPSLIKTNRQSLLTALEMLKGFLAFQANEIEYRSDPSIQLPLTTARGDFQRISDEVNVIARNPGLQPTMTEKEMKEIMDNLAYLQREVGLIGANRPFENRSVERLSGTEGFENEDFSSKSNNPATEDELKNFSAKIQGEVLRLSQSGTTDPLVNARITNLTKMKNDVDNTIMKIQTGAMLSTEVPIMKSDIDNALPILGKLNKPLPQLLKAVNLPLGLANALPGNMGNDPQVSRQINNLIEKYLGTFFEGTSARVNFDIKYTAPNEVKIAEARGKAPSSIIDQTGFPSDHDLQAVGGNSMEVASGMFYGSATDLVDGNMSKVSTEKVTDRYASDPRAEGRSPQHFDWKERARHIEGQIRKRGINETAVGLMPATAKVSDSFSWKGYAKMICERLNSNYDSGLPVACGCPPADWKGW